MSTYVLGDIQGCAEPFFELLKKAKFKPKKDTLWLAGDIVNRGPDNLSVIRYLKKLGDAAVVVLGNHDLHLLATASGVRVASKKDTIQDILEAPDRKQLLKWLRNRPLLHKEKNFVMTHAGIPHIWSVKEAASYAREVEAVLQSKERDDFYIAMYGDEPERWDPSLTGMERLRVITNYLTRMRFCKVDGTLDLNLKNGIDTTPADFLPWFQIPRTSSKKKTLLFGHWAALCGETNVDHAIALDTGCVWGGELTMLRLDDGKRLCVSCDDMQDESIF